MKIFLTLLIISFDENQTDKEISPNICQNDYRQKHHKDKEKINCPICRTVLGKKDIHRLFLNP